MIFKWLEKNKMYAPSWIIIWFSLVLMSVVIFMGITNYHREKNYMGLILKEKGAALIRSFEAGVRTGMMGLFGNEAHLQIFLEETVSRSDIAYIAFIDRNGIIMAHSDKKMIGQVSKAFEISSSFSPADEPRWRTVEGKNNLSFFEVYKAFLPGMKLSGHEKWVDYDTTCALGWMKDSPPDRILDPEHRPAIIIGMDVKPFEEAIAEDLKHNLLMAGLILLLGLTGVVSLSWTQNYINSRKLLQDIRVFASEIVRNLPVGMVVVSSDEKIRFINGVACSLLAIQPLETKGGLARSILPKFLMELREKTNRRKPVAEEEINLPGADNTMVPVNVSTTTIVGEEGQELGFMFILQDLSELRKLEAKIRQREKLAAIGDVAAGIAHEVRNPLSSIRGYATYFGSFFEEGSENRRAAGIMAEEVDRVNRVISELLEFARPSDLKLIKTDICELIEHILGILAHEAEFAGVTITHQLDNNLPELMIDPDRITQVLLNILINAIQAMENGGELTFEAKQKGDTLVLDISDTGKGIPPEDQANMFNPYFTTKKNGTGLGLAIVHKIVENHGGTIEIRSQQNSGTKVSIKLPIIS